MLKTATRKSASCAQARSVSDRKTGFFSQKVWLPKFAYNALPGFYVGSGIAAFLATLYINDWFWVLPHYLLFSIACVHLGVLVYRRRRGKTDEA